MRLRLAGSSFLAPTADMPRWPSYNVSVYEKIANNVPVGTHHRDRVPMCVSRRGLSVSFTADELIQ